MAAPSMAKVSAKYKEFAWHSGITSSAVSRRLRPNSTAVAQVISALARWLRIAPLGRPVVPEVYISAARSVGAPASASIAHPLARALAGARPRVSGGRAAAAAISAS